MVRLRGTVVYGYGTTTVGQHHAAINCYGEFCIHNVDTRIVVKYYDNAIRSKATYIHTLGFI